MIRKSKFSLRALAALLVCVLISSCFVPAFAEEEKTDFSNEIEMLKLFDIAEATLDNDSFTPDAVVARGEFAQYMARLLNVQGQGNQQLYYHDVPKTHYAYDEITVLTQMGILSGVGEGKFAPKEDMMTEYVFGIFLKAIGFGSVASSYSNAEKMNICLKSGILDGVEKTTGPLTLGDLYKMMYNTLFAECFASQTGYVSETNELFMEVTRRVKYVRQGRVTCVDGMDIFDGKIDEDIVIVGGKRFEKPDFDISEYLGRNVRFIYNETEKGNTTLGKIIWIQAINTDDTLYITVDPDCSFNASTGELIYPRENGKVGKVNIPSNITMIYNGRYKKTGIKSVFAKERYELTLVKNNGSNYNLAVVWDYSNVVVKNISAFDKAVYGLGGEKLSLDPDDYEKLEIYAYDGSAVEANSVAVGDVLSYYMTDDKDYCKVYIVKANVTGIVSTVKNEKLEVNGEWFEFYDTNVKLSPYLGKEITLFIDTKGFVAGVEEQLSSNVKVGFLIAGNYREEAFDGTLMLKVLAEDGSLVVIEANDTLYVNDAPYKGNHSGAFSALCDGGTKLKPQMIAYQLRADGKLYKLYTAKADGHGIASHPLTINLKVADLKAELIASGMDENTAREESSYYTRGGGRIGKLMAVGPKTKVFVVPDDASIASAKDSAFRVGANNLMSDNMYDTAVSYRTTEEAGFFEDVILIRSTTLSDKQSAFTAMIDFVETKLDSEGEVIRVISMYEYDGSVVTYELDPDFDYDAKGYTRGDVVKYTTNSITGQIYDMEAYYQPSKGIVKDFQSLTHEYRTVCGFVNDVDANGIKVGYPNGSVVDEVFNLYTSTPQVVIFDKEQDKIFVGTTADLKSYKLYTRDCSPVVIGTRWMSIVSVFAHR